MKTNLDMVREILERGEWVTPFAIQSSIRVKYGVQVSDSAITARLRDLRKSQYGNHVIVCRSKAGSKAHEYRMEVPFQQLDFRDVYPGAGLEVLISERELEATR